MAGKAAQAPPKNDLDPDGADDGSFEDSLGQFSFAVGGKAPTSVSLKMPGGKIDSTEEFEKGALVRVIVEARVGAVEFIDVADPKTGQIVACERRQKLVPMRVNISSLAAVK